MGNGQDSDGLKQVVAGMVALEYQIEEFLVQWLPDAQVHEEAAKAVRRFQIMAEGQREALEACLKRIDGGEPCSVSSIASFDIPAVLREGGPHAESNALHAINSAFNHAAFGYIIKCKNQVEHGSYRHIEAGLVSCLVQMLDVLEFWPDVILQNDPKWKSVRHFRNVISKFLIYGTK